jgi:hypothetical protein
MILKPRSFLCLLRHQEVMTATRNGWITITQNYLNFQQRHRRMTVRNILRTINGTREDCYIYIRICSFCVYILVLRSFVTESLFNFTMAQIQLILLVFWQLPIVWGRGMLVYMMYKIQIKVRLKFIAIFAHSDSTFMYITTSSIEETIFHLPSYFVRSASTFFLPYQLAHRSSQQLVLHMVSQIIRTEFSSFSAKITFDTQYRLHCLRVFYCWEWQHSKLGAVSSKPN